MSDRQNILVNHALRLPEALPASSEQQSQELRAGIAPDPNAPVERRPAKPPRNEFREVAQSLARARWAEWARNKAR